MVAKCRVSLCDWYALAPLVSTLAVEAEHHRREKHQWVRENDLDRLCRITLEAHEQAIEDARDAALVEAAKVKALPSGFVQPRSNRIAAS